MALCCLTFMQVSINFIRTVLAVDALMKREEKEFVAKDLLHVYYIVRPRKNLETHIFFSMTFVGRSSELA